MHHYGDRSARMVRELALTDPLFYAVSSRVPHGIISMGGTELAFGNGAQLAPLVHPTPRASSRTERFAPGGALATTETHPGHPAYT